MNRDTADRCEQLKPLLDNLDEATRGLDIYKPEDALEGELLIKDLRRSRRRSTEDTVGMITLTEVDGVLQWEEGTGVVSMAPGRRARRGPAPAVEGEIVAQYKFERLKPSDVGKFLSDLDLKMTPEDGLRRLDAQGALQPAKAPGAGGKRPTLLFIHGTFSNNDHLFAELRSTPEGQDFIARALRHYGEVLAFDHPTLSVSPVLNALDLTRLFAAHDGPVDVVCHSRGGLVARWWVEGFAGGARGARRVVMVGAPLAGTSLAAPPSLRAALGLITNVGRALSLAGGAASLAVPMLSVAVGLVKVVTSVASLGEKAPLIDAAVAMIPGIAGQSGVSNNAELMRLRRREHDDPSPLPDYFAVRSNFETEAAGWAFWRRYRRWKENLADFGTDMVFEGDNDLVVDSDSMTSLYGMKKSDADPAAADEQIVIPKENVLDFRTNDRVHHTNYFRQPETIEFITKSLGIT